MAYPELEELLELEELEQAIGEGVDLAPSDLDEEIDTVAGLINALAEVEHWLPPPAPAPLALLPNMPPMSMHSLTLG